MSLDPERYVGAIDQGTKGTRFLVFDRQGRVHANAYERHERLRPNQGWLEHHPREIWADTQAVIERGLDRAEIEPTQLAALGVTNQRETTVVWDRESGEPVYNAIVRSDRRTTDRIDEFGAQRKQRAREKTGLEPDAYFSATKLALILDNAGSERGQRALRTRAEAGKSDLRDRYVRAGTHRPRAGRL